jgi:glycosyltransferase involved in cell wall biosynthesis
MKRTIIGYAGAIGFQDGLDYLIRALRHLVYDLGRTDVYCIILGDGDALPSIKQLATELKLNDHIWFAGWIKKNDPKLDVYHSTMQICLSPEPNDPFNDRSTMIKIMEYMKYAKPIVAFDLTEHRFSAGDAAVYVEPNNELAFAQAIANLLDDPDRCKRMGEIGRERVEASLCWEHSVPHLLNLYESLCSSRGKSRRVRFDAFTEPEQKRTTQRTQRSETSKAELPVLADTRS